jgi:acetyl-CoA C-acetyltransferase
LLLQEIVEVVLPGRRGRPPSTVSQDEAPGKLDASRLRGLPPAFPPAGGGGLGTVTAGNASPITDGAAALVLTTPARAAAAGCEVMLNFDTLDIP